MNLRIFPFLVFVAMLVACNEKPKPAALQPETPKALSDKEDVFEYGSKRGSYDIVENLYHELLQKDADLKRLEEKIDALYISEGDSVKNFNNFNQKNEAYFRAAQLQVDQIKDTVLKVQMNKLVAQNLADYKNVVAKHKALLDTIETQKINISDLHRLLKIVKTLPLIKAYQERSLPKTNALKGFVEQQNQVIPLEKKLIKK